MPESWAYIGGEISGLTDADEWEFVPVFNLVRNSWWMLNANISVIDYTLRDLKYDSVVVDITDETNPDYGEFLIEVTQGGTVVKSETVPDDTDLYPITGLVHDTEYTINVKAHLLHDGHWTEDSIQTFRTPDNPIPLAPINLVSAWRTNSYMDLSWTNPPYSSATTFNIYVGYEGAALSLAQTGVTGSTFKVTGLLEDRKYMYAVSGVNAQGLEGPMSNILRWATGHDSKRRQGSISREPLHVYEFGSWRSDIGWNDWHYWPRRVNQKSVFQGFWTNDHRRYRGCVTYLQDDFRHRLDSRYGQDVWRNLNVTCTEIARVYRMRAPGNANAQYMLWYLTNTNIFDSSGAPPIYFGHRNDRNDADAVLAHDRMKAGTAIDSLRLPRGYGHALITGTGWYGPGNGVAVNGLMLHRSDGENNGYGTAGYGEWCGHGLRDRAYPGDAWRYSDWTLMISASWDFEYISYRAPYQW